MESTSGFSLIRPLTKPKAEPDCASAWAVQKGPETFIGSGVKRSGGAYQVAVTMTSGSERRSSDANCKAMQSCQVPSVMEPYSAAARASSEDSVDTPCTRTRDLS